jgi:hypothetical protein
MTVSVSKVCEKLTKLELNPFLVEIFGRTLAGTL